MWIALAVVGFVAILIAVIWLLPVKIIIENDEQNQLLLRYKFLFKTYGENPNPNDPIVRTLKTATGVSRLEGKAVQKNIHKDGLKKTVTESFTMLVDLFEEVIAILKYCKITAFRVDILCIGEDAAEAAIRYGQYSAVVYGLLSALQNLTKIRKRGCKINIACNFFDQEPIFRYHVVLSVSLGRVIMALWKVAQAEAKRMEAQKGKPRK